MKILITGASGFIGKALIPELLLKNHEIIIHTRNPEKYKSEFSWPIKVVDSFDIKIIEEVDAIIALAGENVGQGRWTSSKKDKILNSRVSSILDIKMAMQSAKKFPKIFISAAAIGIYDPPGSFLKEVCEKWEKEIFNIYSFLQNNTDTRVVAVRTGVVLGSDGGALEKMVMPIQWGVGGFLGDGNQYMSWIHIDDLVNIYITCLENPKINGSIDATAPNPVTNKEITRTLAKLLHRFVFLPAPSFILRIVLGEMSDLLLISSKIIPEKMLSLGFNFKYPQILEALKSLNIGELKQFTQYQFINANLEKTFEFFSQAENLEKITPEHLNFSIINKSHPKIQLGTKIEYKLKIHGINLKWITLIEKWNPPHDFVDLQEKGPYKYWHHTHSFHPYLNGVLMKDSIKYSVPGGPVSDIIHFFVKKDLTKIFRFRKKIIEKIFFT